MNAISYKTLTISRQNINFKKIKAHVKAGNQRPNKSAIGSIARGVTGRIAGSFKKEIFKGRGCNILRTIK